MLLTLIMYTESSSTPRASSFLHTSERQVQIVPLTSGYRPARGGELGRCCELQAMQRFLVTQGQALNIAAAGTGTSTG